MYRAVFVSPHLDDAVFSCGGTIALLAAEAPVLILNVFSECEPMIDRAARQRHRGMRAAEDERAAALLGVTTQSLGELDAPLRRAVYRQPSQLFLPPCPEDLAWLPELSARLQARLAELACTAVYLPLGVGWHVDHILCHLALQGGGAYTLHFYEDAPYCLLPHLAAARLRQLGCPEPASALPRIWADLCVALAGTVIGGGRRPLPARWLGRGLLSLYVARMLVAQQAPSGGPRLALHRHAHDISRTFERKLQACALYDSQISRLFPDMHTAAAYYRRHALLHGNGVPVERYWQLSDTRGPHPQPS